ncbi:unnamed protein product [Tuber melanosporum]|uniref:(Perigord truffle) hypothetical protein n=1 Tax=Tuber melanosporum (strain Mel28) TaxID=656061 RepID=D5GNR9_TUBMM|nr:uncharacterized protein GSTUM_00011447001 [Tuber melanosporum]CAZ86166.1 unnamed protein product [Tuber melanosporum]
MAAKVPVPNSWDDEWENQPTKLPMTNNPSTVVTGILRSDAVEFAPTQPLYIPASSQPKTFFKPDLKILKRASSPNSSTAMADAPKVLMEKPRSQEQETEQERRERELKERERRYQETRDKIFASPAPVAKPRRRFPSPSRTAPARNAPAPTSRGNRKSNKTGGKGGDGGGGAITSLSLNGGDFTMAPPPPKIWEIDEKMLESQLAIMSESMAAAATMVKDGEGVEERLFEWDSFERGGWRPCDDPSVVPQYNNNQGPTPPPPAVLAQDKRPGVLRAPRGPDTDGGKGFKGRGRARDVKEFVPGNTWGQ